MKDKGRAPKGPLRLGVLGGSGRMGHAVERLARTSDGLVLEALVSEGEDLRALARVDVVIDFSAPEATHALLLLAQKARLPLVIGTTGLSAEHDEAILRAAKVSPILISANMSFGVYVLGAIAKEAARLLGTGFDVEIVEVHHRKKADAPSGTAFLLAEALDRKGYVPTHGRVGRRGARGSSELGFHALRGGDVIGDHTIHLLGDGERLELTHRATNRDLFAHGALRAARTVAGMSPGRYSMKDIVK